MWELRHAQLHDIKSPVDVEASTTEMEPTPSLVLLQIFAEQKLKIYGQFGVLVLLVPNICKDMNKQVEIHTILSEKT